MGSEQSHQSSAPSKASQGDAQRRDSVKSIDASAYEIPPEMRRRHEKQFNDESRSYEDSLRDLQLVLIIDRSGSMRAPDEDGTGAGKSSGMIARGQWTRWDNVFQAAKYLVDSLFQYDKDGKIPVVFFGDESEEVIATSVDQLLDSFKSRRPTNECTNLLSALNLAFARHVTGEPTLFICFTDGCPNRGQEPHIKSAIHHFLSTNDPPGERLNILFLRVGDDPGAIAFLRDLDDCPEIGNNCDTKSDNAMYAMGPKNLILNAIHEHLDAMYAHII